MSSTDVPIALLGYGTVGAAVSRLLAEGADDIERATGHRLRVVRALVRDPARERGFPVDPGVLTTDIAEIREGVVDRTTLITGSGQPAAVISIARQIGGNIIAIADGVERTLRENAASLPRQDDRRSRASARSISRWIRRSA